MGRMKCKCGNVLSDSMSPNDVKYLVMVHDDIIKKIECYKRGEFFVDDKYTLVWYCSNCKRFYVGENDINKKFLYSLLKVEKEAFYKDKFSEFERLYIYDSYHTGSAYEYMEKGEFPKGSNIEGWYNAENKNVFIKCNGESEIKVYSVEEEW